MKIFASVIAATVLLAPLQAGSQTVWFKYERNPVIAPGPSGTWDDGSVFPNRVIREDTLYVMWYTGWGGSDNNFWRTGRATSPDGVTWTKDPGNPVLQIGPAAWENFGSYAGYVSRAGSQYMMWYTGDSTTGQTPSTRIGYASSADGVHWQKSPANPLIRPASWYAGGPVCPSVLGPDSTGGYKMWFQGDPTAHASFQIGYATATDETTWTVRSEPVFSWGTPGSWDDDKVMAPKVLFDNERYEMFYCGERAVNVDPRTHIGYATSPDGVTWTRSVLNPVLRRGLGWDANDIYLLDVILDQGVYHMWYGGTSTWTNHHIGYAVSPQGFAIEVTPARDTVDRNKDTVRIRVQVAYSPGQSYSVLIRPKSGWKTDTLELYEASPRSGEFVNYWIPGDQPEYTFSVMLKLYDTLTFTRMDNVGAKVVVAVRDREAFAPSVYALSQNYPNPFNPSTTIRYELPKASMVRLTVYDILGREVSVLVNERQGEGSHEAKFDASGLSSGVYLYRFHAGDFVQTRKLIILR